MLLRISTGAVGQKERHEAGNASQFQPWRRCSNRTVTATPGSAAARSGFDVGGGKADVWGASGGVSGPGPPEDRSPPSASRS
jgi:hypothetical protein